MSNYNSSNDIIWAFQSSRVELGVSRMVPVEHGERFVKYVAVAMRREISTGGVKSLVTEKGKDKEAKAFKDTQKTDMGGSRYTVGTREQWLLDKCNEWCRQLSATDAAFATLQRSGMLATDFVPITGSAIASHLGYLAKQFLAQQAAKVTEKPAEVVA